MSYNEMPWISFRLNNENFAIQTTNVTSIINAPSITSLPQMPNYVRGIIKYREEVYKLYDLKKIFSLTTTDEEIENFHQIMDQRKQDHINWLNELENSVHEKREFKLTTDPTKCAFGKWYYSFTTNNHLMRELLDKFELPHNKIHSVAEKVLACTQASDYKCALRIISNTKEHELKLMIDLFDKVKEAYKTNRQEQLILLKNNDYRSAVIVDSVTKVESIEKIDQDGQSNSLLEKRNVSISCELGKGNDGNLLILLDESDFLSNSF